MQVLAEGFKNSNPMNKKVECSAEFKYLSMPVLFFFFSSLSAPKAELVMALFMTQLNVRLAVSSPLQKAERNRRELIQAKLKPIKKPRRPRQE